MVFHGKKLTLLTPLKTPSDFKFYLAEKKNGVWIKVDNEDYYRMDSDSFNKIKNLIKVYFNYPQKVSVQFSWRSSQFS